MAADNFLACDAFTAPAEGGMSTDPADPGNWTGGEVGRGILRGTKYGISAADHPGVNIAGLTPAAAQAIRRAGYWSPNGCDDLPHGIDLMIYDEDVNAGDARSAILLQRLVGVDQDGLIGRITIAAVESMATLPLIDSLADAQGTFYRSLALFSHDGTGWLARLAARRSRAKQMAVAAGPGLTASV